MNEDDGWRPRDGFEITLTESNPGYWKKVRALLDDADRAARDALMPLPLPADNSAVALRVHYELHRRRR